MPLLVPSRPWIIREKWKSTTNRAARHTEENILYPASDKKHLRCITRGQQAFLGTPNYTVTRSELRIASNRLLTLALIMQISHDGAWAKRPLVYYLCSFMSKGTFSKYRISHLAEIGNYSSHCLSPHLYDSHPPASRIPPPRKSRTRCPLPIGWFSGLAGT